MQATPVGKLDLCQPALKPLLPNAVAKSSKKSLIG
jgi:hypothetical protein